MKRIKNIIVLCLTMFLFFIITGCVQQNIKKHIFDIDHECIDRICSECGELIEATKEHQKDNNYDCRDGSCIECGEIIKATIEHNFNNEYICECGENIENVKFEITFLDFEGNVSEVYVVNFGDLVDAPKLDVPEDVKYIWKIDNDVIENEFYFNYFTNKIVRAYIITEHKETYTYNIFNSYSPSNWNVLDSLGDPNEEIIDYISSNLFEFNYKFDSQGAILPGQYVVEYSAARKLEDVSAQYVGEKWGIEEGAQHRAYKITLRDDLKWDDGMPINAYDFVYSMEEQLNPLFKYYRAEEFYLGNVIIHNAENYVKQGMVDPEVENFNSKKYTVADLVKGEDGVYTQPNGAPIHFNYRAVSSYLSNESVQAFSGYLDAEAYAALTKMANIDGWIDVTDETLALWAKLIYTADWGYEGPEYIPYYLYYEYTYPTVDFEDVGMFVPGENPYEFVIVLDKPLQLLNDDGSLCYKTIYNLSSLPLVHRQKYEANKVEPAGANVLWTSKYNSSVGTTASWGPYKLSAFQTDKQYILERNPNWYGYNMEEYAGQYQTDIINCEIIKEWNTAWIKFRSGEIDDIGMDSSIADSYKGSERAYFTPDDYVGSIQLQSSKNALEEREREGVNKTMLTYVEFRQALSLAINRDEYNRKCSTSSLAGYGLFNSMHYYDVINGGVYRNEDVAKQVLCEVYGVNVEDYESLDAAYAAITGYNLELARQLVDIAYDKAFADGEIDGDDVVKLQFGSSVINTTSIRSHNFIRESWLELVKGTKLEGRLAFEEDIALGSRWGTEFRNGTYDVCIAGWSGAAWDPGYFLLAYLSPAYMYSTAWDTSSVMMEFTMPGVGENGEDVTDTMSLIDWYACLNGSAGCKYNWAEGALPNTKRLLLIAALEKEVLSVYYSVPIQYSFGASLISYKIEYISYDYNTFMGYGGIRYIKYNFSDYEWEQYVEYNGGEIVYK